MRPLDLLAMLHLARPTLPPFLSPPVNPRRSSSTTALARFCPIFCFPLPSRLSLVWLSSSCYTSLGFLTLSVSWNYWKRAKKKKREAKGNKNKKKENRAHLEEEKEGVSLVFHSRQAGVFRAAKTVQGSCQIKIFRSLAPLVCFLLLLPRTPPCYTFFLVCCCCRCCFCCFVRGGAVETLLCVQSFCCVCLLVVRMVVMMCV